MTTSVLRQKLQQLANPDTHPFLPSLSNPISNAFELMYVPSRPAGIVTSVTSTASGNPLAGQAEEYVEN